MAVMLLLAVAMVGITGWARAFYLISDEEAAEAARKSGTGISATLLHMNGGRQTDNAQLKAGTLVTVCRGGTTLSATAQDETVKQFLARMDIVPGPLEMVGIEEMERSVTLTVSDHLTVYEKVTEEAPYETVYRTTPDLPQGQERVIQAGVDGQHTAVYEQTWAGGALVSSQYVETLGSTAVDQIVERGSAMESVAEGDSVTGVTTYDDGSGYLTFASGGTMKFKKAMQMTATAYTAGYDGADYTTATGTFVRTGVVAVDRKVIPLGTRMYVMAKGVEYGLSDAEDTGVRGNVIDLYLHSYNECIQFGRRSATVYILEENEG